MVKLGAVKLNNGALNALSIGGANAHSANVVAAIFLATGQVIFIDFFSNFEFIRMLRKL